MDDGGLTMPTTLITGANRGLGLEFARQYAADGWRVFACCRQPDKATELNDLAALSGDNVTVHPLDVARGDSVTALADTLRGEPIDVLLSNAGMYGDEERADFGRIDYDRWAETFSVNVLGVMRVVESFVDNVASSERKVLALMSSLMGSMADNTSGGAYLYRSSKAALNAVGKSLSHDLKDRGIVSVILHPGWVETDMGGKNAPLQPPESIAGMRRVLDRARIEDSGRFLAYDGRELPW
jgi:NAD(P)-dependent dehydrogenase (short-subunit alcohol dehydrogenase family)